MRYAPDLLDEIRARLPVSQVVGRRVKLKKQGREFIGLCPFHADSKPSLGVNDQKDLWNCFPCGKHGDQFGWLMQCEGIGFTEAVKQLAEQAGFALPERDAESTRREARKLTLIEIVAEAATFFRDQLRASASAITYLASRKIGPALIEQFGLGFAPADRSSLKAHFAHKGIDQADAVEAGLIIAGEDIAVSHDRFRNRIMFPIFDKEGRPIGFGGRDLSGESPAKYLNTAETPIFDKGRTLYNANNAREPAWNEKPLIVVEGYTATIASSSAGFPATVAPMGTALTESHLLNLWRMSDCPTIAFDGDSAGRMASRRAIATALPLMIPGRLLKIASMPAGQDPDDLVRSRGAQAYADALGGAQRLVDVLWEAEGRGRSLSLPDDRAALEAALIGAVDVIPDANLRDQYRREYRDRIRSIPMRRMNPLRSNSHSQHSISPGNISLTHKPASSGMNLRAAMLILAVIRAPGAALQAVESLVADKRLAGEAGDVVHRALDVLAELPEATSDELLAALDQIGVGGSVAAARDLCHRSGITSLDPEAGTEAATALLTRH